MTNNEIINLIKAMDVGDINLMEVCGTHTHAIAKSGIKHILPENIHLLSGPGCPVCVTPWEVIDAFLELSLNPNVIITTYGDMIRVPGSAPGDNLTKRRAMGANVKVVYSPVDAIQIAKENPDKEIVFLGVGFETTAPGTAMAIKLAKEQNVKNFSVLSMLKSAAPSIKALISDKDFNVNGFILPGHVAVIVGEDGFKFLENDYKIPSVITGFEPEDILKSIYNLTSQIKNSDGKVLNEYTRLVKPSGNTLALEAINEMFELCDDNWRGLGEIPMSGFKIKDEFSEFDAKKKFNISYKKANVNNGCKCGDVIKGVLDPTFCPLFGKACNPEDPVGPCMVSGEGACSAAYKYRDI